MTNTMLLIVCCPYSPKMIYIILEVIHNQPIQSFRYEDVSAAACVGPVYTTAVLPWISLDS